MARPLRIEVAGALYHGTARGNKRRSIFFSDEDRFRCISTLDEVCVRFNWRCHAYCEMTNPQSVRARHATPSTRSAIA